MGYINPIFEHYHSMGQFHLAEMFAYVDTLEEYGALRKHKSRASVLSVFNCINLMNE